MGRSKDMEIMVRVLTLGGCGKKRKDGLILDFLWHDDTTIIAKKKDKRLAKMYPLRYAI